MPSEEQQVSLADLVIEDLTGQLASAQRDLSIAKARIKQLESFIRANAQTLGLQTNDDGTMTASMPSSPVPGDQSQPPARPARRASTNGRPAAASAKAET